MAGNWEAVFFQMLAKNFGLNINGDAFFSIASPFLFRLLEKSEQVRSQMEALLWGRRDSYGALEDPIFFHVKKDMFI